MLLYFSVKLLSWWILRCWLFHIKMVLLQFLSKNDLKYSFLELPALSIKKSTTSVTKSLHQDPGLCYFTCLFFSYTYIHTLFFYNKIKFVVIFGLTCKLDHRLLFNYICYKTILVWGIFSTWITNTTHCLYYIPY